MESTLAELLTQGDVDQKTLIHNLLKSLPLTDSLNPQTLDCLLLLAKNTPNKKDNAEVWNEVVEKVSPMLLKENVCISQSEKIQLKIVEIIKVCFGLCSEVMKEKIKTWCMLGLRSYSIDSQDSGRNMDQLVHILDTVLQEQNDPEWTEVLFVEVLELLEEADQHVSGQLAGLILPKILRANSSSLECRLSALWEKIYSLFERFGQKGYKFERVSAVHEQPFLLLCGLADFFFPVNGEPAIHPRLESRKEFWMLLQTGFFQSSSLSRKRSMYLLKRIQDIHESCGERMDMVEEKASDVVMWWNPDDRQALSTVWTNFILLMEALEEKQVHVIKPLMPRFHSLVEATYQRKDGRPLLHTSWVVTVSQRVASHDSAYIRRWGIHQLLAVDLTKCPLLDQNGQQFICGPLISMLTEPIVYHKSHEEDIGECPPGGRLVKQFLLSCYSTLKGPDRVTFYELFMECLTREPWSGAALTFVLQGISSLPSSPVWTKTVIPHIRELLISCTRTMDTIFKDSVQCFLALALPKLLDQACLDFEIVTTILSLFTGDGCLQRGNSLWRKYVVWLQNLCDTASAQFCGEQWIKYVKSKVLQYLSVPRPEECVDEQKVFGERTLGPLMLLLTDAEILKQDLHSNQHPLVDILSPAVAIMVQVNTHAYMSHQRADQSLRLLTSVCGDVRKGQEISSEQDIARTVICKCIDLCLPDALVYIERSIAQDMEQAEFVSSTELYCEYIRMVGTLQSAPMPGQVSSLSHTCIHILQQTAPNMQLRKYRAMMLIGCILECDRMLLNDSRSEIMKFLNSWQPVTELHKPVSFTEDTQALSSRKSGESTTWGRISCDFLSSQWTCLQHLLNQNIKANSMTDQDYVDYMDHALGTLDVVSGPAVVPVLKCIHLLLPKCEDERVIHILEVCWSKVKEDNKCINFWPSYKAFIHLAFQPNNLHQGEQSEVTRHLKQVMSTILSLGEEKGGVVNVLADHLCGWWLADPANLAHALKYKTFITEVLLFGPCHVKGKRIMHEVHAYLSGMGDELTVNQHNKGYSSTDNLARAGMLTLLASMRPDICEHQELGTILLHQLMQKQKQLIQVRAYRTFSNSLAHRQKHRIFTAIILLENFINQDMLDCLVLFLMESLVTEIQPSVRCMAEWMIIRMTLKYPSVQCSLWCHLQNTSEKKSACICSLLTVITHMAKLIDSDTKLESFMLEALPQVLPLCTAHHFNCRIFALACVHTLWNVCQQRALENVINVHYIMGNFVDKTRNNSHAWKSISMLLNNFWYIFHPLKDHSLQTLFYTLPQLMQISDEEWIHPDVFQHSISASTEHIPVYNPRKDLDTCQPGNWKVKVIGIEAEQEESGNGDVQKKIMPWKYMLPQQELEPDLVEEYTSKVKDNSGLVVVTSLIEKIPNLGGLCRTCEIFGVSEYVIGSLKYVEDKNFETLAVTAHKWVPVKEVRPEHLHKYLMEMKAEGYTLVGAEQTASSQQLTNYAFPHKTVLILGNEKAGIPVDLIQLLDVCVEIPQQGIIRSLNVHVSGALLIWEYARQHVFT